MILSAGISPLIGMLGVGGIAGGALRLLGSYSVFFAYTFSVGILVALLPRERLSKLACSSGATILSFIALGITLCWIPPKHGLPESIGLVTPFACVCLGNTWFGLLSSRALRFLGRISYSFYLLHFLGLTVVLMMMKGRGLLDGITPVRYWMIACGCGMVTLVVCAFSYQWLEDPFLHVGQSRTNETLPVLASIKAADTNSVLKHTVVSELPQS